MSTHTQSPLAALQNSILLLQNTISRQDQVLTNPGTNPGAGEHTPADATTYNVQLNDVSTSFLALLPAVARLSEPERQQLETPLATLLATLENAIAALTVAREETASQLKTLHHRTSAIAAYGKR